MIEIEQLAAEYAAARAVLAGLVTDLQVEIDRITRSSLPGIRSAVGAVADIHDSLQHAIEAVPEKFMKPRTRVFSGVRCGYLTGKPRVEIPDEAETLRRIRAQLPKAQIELLIAVSERVDKRAVADLTAADLKRLRISVVPGTDEVVIKPTDSAVDKLVDALLKDAEHIEEFI